MFVASATAACSHRHSFPSISKDGISLYFWLETCRFLFLKKWGARYLNGGAIMIEMETVSGEHISKIGIGSYGIGGRGHRDVALTEKIADENYIDALIYALQKGLNFTEISLGYGHGNALDLFKKAFDKSSIKREDIFFTHSLYPRDLSSPQEIKKDISDFYGITGFDYADSTLVTLSLFEKFGKQEIYSVLHDLLESEKSRYVSLSNADPITIRDFKKEFGDKFVAHEGHLSFEIRTLQDEGIFRTCDELNVKNIIWRPLRRNKTMHQNWPMLAELAEKYGKTQNQIVLNWICSLGYHPMVMSTNKTHIHENIAATEFQMSKEECRRMTDFRPSKYHPPRINWGKKGEGDSIVDLVNNFEQHRE